MTDIALNSLATVFMSAGALMIVSKPIRKLLKK
jgi:hypothetical protein